MLQQQSLSYSLEVQKRDVELKEQAARGEAQRQVCGGQAGRESDFHFGGWASIKQPQNLGDRDTLEGKGPQSRPQKRLERRLEKVAKAVGGGDFWL